MDEPELPLYEDVANALLTLQLGVDAADLHGALCGYLSARGEASRVNWMERLHIEADNAAVASNTALDAVFRATRAQLDDTDLGFALLLPDDDAPVEGRVDALLSWCRGFLGGFGLASGDATLSPDAEEALQDIGRIAGFNVADDEAERDEEAFAEIAEFVRVAALLLHADTARDADARKRLH